MTDVTVTATSATLRDAFLASRPTHSFNDIPERPTRLTAMQELVESRFTELDTQAGCPACQGWVSPPVHSKFASQGVEGSPV